MFVSKQNFWLSYFKNLSYDTTNDGSKNDKDGPIEQFTTKIEGVRKRNLKGFHGQSDAKGTSLLNESNNSQGYADPGISDFKSTVMRDVVSQWQYNSACEFYTKPVPYRCVFRVAF